MRSSVFYTRRRKLEITSADAIGLLNAIVCAGIDIAKVELCGELIINLIAFDRDYKKICDLSRKYGGSVKTLKKYGIFFGLHTLRKRAVLMITAVALLGFFVFLPTRILFVRVDGNTTIPSAQIIETAAECGIQFGASARRVRSEKMKNALLEKLPQLQWAGINTSGCTATISVKEKSKPNDYSDEGNRVCSIVAARDGIVQSCTVYQGNALCVVGQAVKAGQTLVSGYTDCGNYVQATKADAEINALTSRELEVITPSAALTRGKQVSKKTEYSIRIGKKLIKLTKDSGIFHTTCAKIYAEEYVHLPGGFRLPVALVTQTVYGYENAEDTAADEDWMYSFAETYLQSQMVAGEIVSTQAGIEIIDGATRLYGRYACMEMIGRVKYEQTILKDGTND